MSTERIYIGGLSPSKGLTVSLVASRLMSVKGVEILSINDAPIDSCDALNQSKYAVVDADGDLIDKREFFFLEARCSSSDTNEEDAKETALDLLAKQYNNTKWKGCNLRVESARPHFLKRLEVERAERKEKKLAADAAAAAIDCTMQEDITSVESENEECIKEKITVRRRLRIRRRFGEEAFHVDTHPQTLCITDNSEWEQFAHLHKRMQEKFASQRMKLVERRKVERKNWMTKGSKGGKEPSDGDFDLRSLMFLNRGIHVRFNDAAMVDLTSPSSSDASDDEENEAYVWSDDDSIEYESQGNAAKCDTTSDKEVEEVSTEEESLCSQKKAGSKYLWSDDDSDGSSKQKKSSEFRMTPNALDEFSGMDFKEDDTNHFDSYESNESVTRHLDDVSIHLEDDIRSNLGILSKLFPGESISNTPLTRTDSIAKPKASAFGSGLIVARFDPTKDDAAASKLSHDENKDASKNLNEAADKDESETDDSSIQKSSKDPAITTKQADENGSCESESVKDDTETKVSDRVDLPLALENEPGKEIYEQDKLEDIFKQAREQQRSTGFMFESQLGDASTEKQTDRVSTNFGFGFAFQLDDAVSDVPESTTNQTTSNNDTNGVITSKQPMKETQRRKVRVGLQFPVNVLDEYESLFFSLNEGSRIIADHQSMQENEEVQEKWQKEREVLTADWKRKQKGALSRKVKKVKRY